MNKPKRLEIANKVFPVIGFLAAVFGLVMVIFLIYNVVTTGFPRLNWQFLISFPSRKPLEAGILSAWVGTIWIVVTTVMVAFPAGVSAAIYLEEYAKKNWMTELIEINIANLSAVPAIIYGLLGLELFVRILKLGNSVLAGGLTMGLLVLPTIIISSREAIRSIPSTIREASYALGATKWQTIRKQVIPAAMPGILTGAILAISRAIGEAAPLIMIGALTYIAFLPEMPIKSDFPFISLKGLFDGFTNMPIQIFNWVTRPQRGFSVNAAAAITILLVIVFIINGIVALLRNRYEKKMRW
ncbi:phosphate ABC transporter permease PstA [Candidatus Magnetomonas plexicatena]|uniref:phosphate ABC transporter permease PstA n=1 Tax=Candidatus Magnetomonas plexicatena TaxID=2552947 RepID=UPI001C762673|nr:phosphate ABC transporter permease PstA [Nitrospirales bacterium LBB_01]